jgi:hypothetical protein
MSDLTFKILSSKAENNSLIIEGIASNSSIDTYGEKIIITSEALDKAIPIFLGAKKTLTTVRSNRPNGTQIGQNINCPNNGYMKYHHGGIDKDFNQVGKASIGKVLEMDYDKISDLEIDIRAKCEIRNPMVINLINRGYAKCFSLSWFWLVRTIDNINACFIDSNIAILELSVTPNPVNKQAKFEIMDRKSKFAIGQKVLADQIPMAVKAVMRHEDNVFYELEALVGSFKSGLVFPEENLKAIESIKADLTGKIVVKNKTQDSGKINISVRDIKIAS